MLGTGLATQYYMNQTFLGSVVGYAEGEYVKQVNEVKAITACGLSLLDYQYFIVTSN